VGGDPVGAFGVRGGDLDVAVACDRHDVAELEVAQACGQLRVEAVGFVAGDEPCRDAGGDGLADHVEGQFGLGREHDVVGNAADAAALAVRP
jgi:hypothetical protein